MKFGHLRTTLVASQRTGAAVCEAD
jgi:hypothetical protein